MNVLVPISQSSATVYLGNEAVREEAARGAAEAQKKGKALLAVVLCGSACAFTLRIV